MNTFNGLRIIESTMLTRRVPSRRTRTWRERWLSWPWRPWARDCACTIEEPDPMVYQVPGGLMMHPATAQQFKAMVRKLGSQ